MRMNFEKILLSELLSIYGAFFAVYSPIDQSLQSSNINIVSELTNSHQYRRKGKGHVLSENGNKNVFITSVVTTSFNVKLIKGYKIKEGSISLGNVVANYDNI